MDMKVNMNGLRQNLVSAYNRTVRRLREFLEENCTDSEIGRLHREIDGDIDELRMEIGFLCCTYEEGNEDFSNMSDEIDGLLDFTECSGEDEG